MVETGKPTATEGIKANAAGRATWAAYGFAMVVTLLTLVARLSVTPWVNDRPFLVLFFIPIILSAYIGGLGPGLVATFIAAAGSQYYLLPPFHSFWFAKPMDFVQWLIFVAGGVMASILNEALHRARKRAALSDALHSVTLSSIGDAVITTDAKGRVIFLNQEAERLTGWTQAEAAGQPLPSVFHIIHEQTRELAEDPVKKVFRTGAMVELANHTVLIARDGREFVIDDSGAPIRGADGSIIGVVLVFRDDTEKKRAQDALAESQLLYHSLVDQMPAGVFRKDAEGRYTFVNLWFCQIKGIRQEEMLGKTPLELARYELTRKPTDDGTETQLAIQGDQHHQTIMRTGQMLKVEEEYAGPNGRKRYLHVVKIPVFNASGKTIGSMGVMIDVTERKQHEQSRAQLAAIVESSSDAIVGETLDGIVTSWNRGAELIFGYTAEEAIGRALMILPPERRQEEESILNQIRRGENIVYFETVRVRKDGKAIDVAVTISPLTDGNGTIIGASKIARDITAQKQAEAALTHERELLRTLLENSPDQIYFKDAQSRFLRTSNAQLENFRVKDAGELIGKTDFDFFDQAHAQEAFDDEQKIMRTGQPIIGKVEKESWPDGRECWVLASKMPFRNKAGEIIGTFGVSKDITELKRAEAALRESQALYHSLVEQLPAGIFRKDAAGRFVFANPWFCRLKQMSAEQILGRTALEIATGESSNPKSLWQRELAIQGNLHHDQIMRTGQPVELEEIYPGPNGQPQYLQIVKSAVFGPDKKIIGSQGVVFDITERKLVADKLTREQARFKLIFDALPIGIAFHTTHPDGSVTRNINEAHLRICGLTREQHNEPGIYARITHADDQVIQSRLKQQVEAGLSKQFALEKRYLRMDGKLVWVNFSYQRETYPDGTQEELTTVLDITERKRLEEQLRQSQKMEAIGQLSGGIAHDFNNILTAILGNASLLADPELQPGESKECLDEITHAARRAADLTRQLLLFSRKQAMQTATVDLNQIVTHSLKMLQRILGEDVTLHSELSPGLPLVSADTSMVEQAILNLAINARDAMPNGGRLEIRSSAERLKNPESPVDTEAQVHTCLTVTDNGSGIAPEILPRIFEPFFTTKEVGKGTGLGLATVYGIVRQHGGWITVRSQPGQGSTFQIYFPAVIGKAPGRPAAQPRAQLPRGTGTILVVEDEPPVRHFVCQFLRRLGYTIIEAGNGQEALERWHQQREEISLVLTDVIMPGGMTGQDLATKLRAEAPQLKIVFTSGYTGNAAGGSIPLREGENFIRKPFAPEALAEIIRKKIAGED